MKYRVKTFLFMGDDGDGSTWEVTHYPQLRKWSAIEVDGTDAERNEIGAPVTGCNYRQIVERVMARLGQVAV